MLKRGFRLSLKRFDSRPICKRCGWSAGVLTAMQDFRLLEDH